ncbi:MAG TPA: hypothetical protein DIT97_04715 [Gimesia maris]|uniref:Uncharacterized protein n=1 Tax=Gimesia maris TaxID=122 RepID=A0A3D3R0M1_9PLAN|nr:hypothetical protein [Gimesia maris]|tara:strand:- start:59869 stop:60711 length:843 start_codon:yes stop_codon:yes gene_type:complete
MNQSVKVVETAENDLPKKKDIDPEIQKTHLAGKYQVLTALIGVIGLIIGSFLTYYLTQDNKDPKQPITSLITPPPRPKPIITQIESLHQRANDKGHAIGEDGEEIVDSLNLPHQEKDELATFRFTVYNPTPNLIELADGMFVGNSPVVRRYKSEKLVVHPIIIHKDHINVWLKETEATSFPIHTLIPAGESRDFTVWFRMRNPNQITSDKTLVKHGARVAWTYKVNGIIRLKYDEEMIESKPIEIIIHSPIPTWDEVNAFYERPTSDNKETLKASKRPTE